MLPIADAMPATCNTNATYLIIIDYRMSNNHFSNALQLVKSNYDKNEQIIGTQSMKHQYFVDFRCSHQISVVCYGSHTHTLLLSLCVCVCWYVDERVCVHSSPPVVVNICLYFTSLSVFSMTLFGGLSCVRLILALATIVVILCFCWSTIPFLFFFFSSSLSYAINPGTKRNGVRSMLLTIVCVSMIHVTQRTQSHEFENLKKKEQQQQ